MAATILTNQSASTPVVTDARQPGRTSRWLEETTPVGFSTVAVFSKSNSRRCSLIAVNDTANFGTSIHATKQNFSKPAAMYATDPPEPHARERRG